jgi:hypothetical protein
MRFIGLALLLPPLTAALDAAERVPKPIKDSLWRNMIHEE